MTLADTPLARFASEAMLTLDSKNVEPQGSSLCGVAMKKYLMVGGQRGRVADDRRAMLNIASSSSWSPRPNSRAAKALAKAARHGLMSENQYRFIAGLVCREPSCNMLVFGGGYDAELWHQCVHGRITFVENKPEYLQLLPGSGVYLEFKSKVGIWTKPTAPPYIINRSWDFVLIDGPKGHDPNCPGRQLPIAWAAQLARKAVFVHDYERHWERAVSDKYLGSPDLVLDASGRQDRKLGLFDRSRRLPQSLTRVT